ncbi:hypothetical protein APTSU1_000219900 [Apodemus speciosus]|uniref:Uncharacterized protein n=1 Tax=Apodemus speciosus TaxID=105296 RepID=A0ABQ0EIN8_APOSI
MGSPPRGAQGCFSVKGEHQALQGIRPCPGGGATRCSAYRTAFAQTWKSPPGQ